MPTHNTCDCMWRSHKKLKYFLKHKFGMSEGQTKTPKNSHGVDLVREWETLLCIGLSSVAVLFVHATALPSDGHIYHPDGWEEITAGVDAFVDDTTQTLAVDDDAMSEDLCNDMQMNSNLWNGSALATGGALNPQKGCCSIFQWSFTPDGLPHLLEPGEFEFDPIALQTNTGERLPMQQTRTSDAVHCWEWNHYGWKFRGWRSCIQTEMWQTCVSCWVQHLFPRGCWNSLLFIIHTICFAPTACNIHAMD